MAKLDLKSDEKNKNPPSFKKDKDGGATMELQDCTNLNSCLIRLHRLEPKIGTFIREININK
jgi:hypothetical protein